MLNHANDHLLLDQRPLSPLILWVSPCSTVDLQNGCQLVGLFSLDPSSTKRLAGRAWRAVASMTTPKNLCPLAMRAAERLIESTHRVRAQFVS